MSESAAQAPRLSVVTISWNQRDDIADYLAAMEKARQELPFALEVVLVDNGSADDTLTMVRERFPWVRLVENGRNLGFAVGCNVGLRAATGEYLLLLNPDAEANAPALAAMVEYLDAHPDTGAVGCMLMHGDGLPQQSAFAPLGAWSYIHNHSMLYPLREKLRKRLYRSGIARKTSPFECGWLQGSCTMVPRRVYEQVGELEPSYFIYCEDADWCFRIRQAGHKVVHLPNVSLLHHQMGSVKKRPEYFFRRVYRSIVHYANRHLAPGPRARLLLVMKIDMMMRLPVYWLRGILSPGKREAMKARRASVHQLLAITRAGNPDLFDDPPPR